MARRSRVSSVLSTERASAINSLLHRISLEASAIAEPIVQMGINLTTISAKKSILNYEETIIKALRRYPDHNSSFQLLIPAFIAMEETDPVDTIHQLFDFFPSFFGDTNISLCNAKNIFAFLPRCVQGDESKLTYISSFFSEAIFAKLMEYILSSMKESLDDDVAQLLLNRIFVKSVKNVDPGSLQFDILVMIIKRYKRILRHLCKTCFAIVNKTLVDNFPAKKEHPMEAVIYLTALSMIRFPGPCDVMNQLTKMFEHFNRSPEVISALLDCFCSVLPQGYTDDAACMKRIERRIEPFIRIPDLWRSSLILSGVVQAPGLHTRKYDRFIERYVYKRMVKPMKMKYAIGYMNSILSPIDSTFNWNPEIAPYVKVFYQHFLTASVDGAPKEMSILLKNIAMYDFQRFVNEIVPEVLKMNDSYLSVLFRTCEMIMNPLEKFQEMMKQSPQADIFEKSLGVLYRKISEFLIAKKPCTGDEDAYVYRPVSEIFRKVNMPALESVVNDTIIPSPVLYFIMKMQHFMNLEGISPRDRDVLKQNEQKCSESLEVWSEFFDLPHQSFGDLQKKQNLKIKTTMEESQRWEINALKVVHLIMAKGRDFAQHTPAILSMVTDACVSVAFAASLTYESFFLAFPSSAVFFLNEIGRRVKSCFSLSPESLHRIVQLYEHCLKMCADTLGSFSSSVIDTTDFIAFCGLCSPYPETRLVAMSILDHVEDMQLQSNDKKMTLARFLKTQASVIEQSVAVEILTSFVSTSSLHRIPSIDFYQAVSCPFSLLWMFFLAAIFKTVVDCPLVPLLASLRTNFIDNLSKSLDKDRKLNSVEVNKLLYVMVTGSSNPSHAEPIEKRGWISQISRIHGLIDSIVNSQYETPECTFVFAFVHLGTLEKVINSILKLIESEHSPGKALGLLAAILRHVSLHEEFNDYIGHLAMSGQTKQILMLFDKLLPKVTVSSESTITLTLCDFLVFRAMYFKYLYQSHLDMIQGPIPRCVRCTSVSEDEISPVLDVRVLFELLFEFSQGSGTFSSASRMAITYLAALTPIYKKKESFTPKFFEGTKTIMKAKPTFLRYLLTNHFSLLLSKFLENGLSMPLAYAEIYLEAVAYQFIPPVEKDSFIHSHDTFVIKSDAQLINSRITEQDEKFAQLIHSETGTMLLLGLVFLMHDSVRVRQTAMKMMIQIAPIMYLMRSGADKYHLKELMRVIRKAVISISTQNKIVLMESNSELSGILAKLFVSATEQVFSRAFAALPKIWQTRKCCTRDEVMQLLKPWVNNIKFNLKSHFVAKQRYGLYSCYTFVHELCTCMSSIDWSDPFMKFWQELTEKTERSFLVLAIIDIGVSNRNLQDFVIRLLSYLYRLSPNAVNFLVPLINYSNWYFYHVQLGKFGEIRDMDKFLECSGADADSEKSHDQYNESVEFAIRALIELAKEDIMPLASEDNYAVIVSFCLTHLNKKGAFDLLCVYAEVLRTSFDSGVPCCLRNINELLERASTIPFDNLRFMADCRETPLRALQNRIVSLSSLLDWFVSLLSYFSTQEEILGRCFLLWGISCGDLGIAAKALSLYSVSFHTTDPIVISHLMNSICIVMRCWITSHGSSATTNLIAEYINPAMRVVHRILIDLKKAGADLGAYIGFFDMVVAIVSAKGEILPLIVTEALNLLTDLIRYKCFNSKADYDFLPVLISAVLTCKDYKVLFPFIIHVFELPSAMLSKDNNYALYLVVFAPLLCCSIEAPQSLSGICELSEIKTAVKNLERHFHSTHVSALLSNMNKNFSSQTFCHDLMHTLAALTHTKTLEVAAVLLSALVPATMDFQTGSLFDLAASLLSVRPSKEICDGLVLLTGEATLNQFTPITTSKVRYLQAISNFSEGGNFSYFKVNDDKSLLMEKELTWEKNLKAIQDVMPLKTIYKNSDRIFKVRFDSVDSFPPIFPFQEELLKCPIVAEVTNFCRNIQVNPQSNWAFSLYCSTVTFLCQADLDEGEVPRLTLDLPFMEIIQQVFEQIIEEEEEAVSETGEAASEDEATDVVAECVYSFGTGENRTNSIDIAAFLPDPDAIDDILEIRSFQVVVPK